MAVSHDATTDQVSPPTMRGASQRVGVVGTIVILLGLASALIHLYLVPDEFKKGATGYGTAFILTGVAYLVGILAAYIPVAAFAKLRSTALVCLALLAIGSIAAYLSLGYFDTLGWWTKAIEAALVVAVGAQLAADRSAA